MIEKIKIYFLPSILVILIFLILFYIIGILYGDNSISRLNTMTQEKATLEHKIAELKEDNTYLRICLLYTSPSPRDPL